MTAPQPRRDQSGYTLIELVVAMGMASVLLVAMSTVVIGTLRGVTTLNVKTATTADARTTMEAMSRSMRVTFKPPRQSAAIVTATDHELVFYSLVNRTGSKVGSAPNPTLVRYSHDGTCINQTMTPATADSAGVLTWTTGAVTTCLARTGQKPSFEYYDSGAADGVRLPAGLGMSLDNRTRVRSIATTIEIQDVNTPGISAVLMQDRVTLTNLVADDNNDDDAPGS